MQWFGKFKEVHVRNVPQHTEYFQHLPCGKANVIFCHKVKKESAGLKSAGLTRAEKVQ